ncbi:hypothetical protein [Peribacillus sp. TH14]|nr:hypothetical protein [Peribacillus sp. TH14]MBK5500690.1 hypothetical protein [Peribacillus sp. TH14]
MIHYAVQQGADSTVNVKMGRTALGKAKSNSSGKFTVAMTIKTKGR